MGSERPILFRGPLVEAILDGRKTATRRVVRPQPVGLSRPWPGHEVSVGGRDYRCPYGAPGDRLWVRETFWQARGNGALNEAGEFEPGPWLQRAGYGPKKPSESAGVGAYWSCRPSIHMPRWASRITLEVEEVRIERLREITLEGIEAEATPVLCASSPHPWLDFAVMWDLLSAVPGERWEDDPWVWVVRFKKEEGS